MNKELEALEELERFVNEDIGIKGHHESGWHLADKPEFHLIKSALKKQEQDQKKLKALEIIKDKKVDVSFIIENPEAEDVFWYNSSFTGVLCEGWRMLTQQEYDLLKEVLYES